MADFKLSHNTTHQMTRKPISLNGKANEWSTNNVVFHKWKKMSNKKNKESNPDRTEFIMQKGYNASIINREKGDSVFAHADQTRPRVNTKKNKEEISTIPSVNNLLEQPLQNENVRRRNNAWSGWSE